MKYLLMKLLLATILLSANLYADSEENLREYFTYEDSIAIHGAGGDSKHVGLLLKAACLTRTEEISDIESGANTVSSKSINYGMMAEIHVLAFKSLTGWREYESAIYNAVKEKTVFESNDWMESFYGSFWKKRYSKQARQYIYLLEKAKTYWLFCYQSASYEKNEEDVLAIKKAAESGISYIDNMKKMISENTEAEK